MITTVRWLVPALLAVVVGGACTDGDGGGDSASATTATTATSTTATPVPEPADTGPVPGELLEVTEAEVGGLRSWTVRYLSTGVDGELVEVTGQVLAPDGEAVGDIVAWAHGTTGVGDTCAPSASPGAISEAPRRLAEAGYVVAITDYEGLGSEGTHPYLVGPSEARSTIDIVRAAARIDGLDAGASRRFAVAGLSQGGHAALWTGEVVEAYAPELTLVGVVAAAPATNITDLMRTVGTPAQGFAVLGAYAYAATYDDVELEAYFTPEAIEAMEVVETGCTAEVFAAFLDRNYDDMVVPGGWDGTTALGPLADRLAENEAGQADIAAPVLLVQGEADAIVARELVEALHERYCSMATNAEYRLYLGGGHVDTIITAIDEVIGWLDDRFAGVDAGDGCAIVDPDLVALRAAEDTDPAVEGTLLDGRTPEGYDTLVSETNAPRPETCPGTPIFGGRAPVAYSESVWLVNQGIGPFLDAFVARFASAEEASAAFQALDAELIDCGRFVDPATSAEGRFTRGDDPGLGDESFESLYSGSVGGIAVNRVGYTVRVGDTIYSTSQTQAFAGTDPAVALEAVMALLP